ncbi:aldo/keto reductase [Aerococcus urinae]|uniref:Aldo/keto reductase n=2 Tax=Aerococcus urinae TaxID=1376 RepID=A0ABT4C4V0_9LACT|nr:aldo/keto reductase [Aerococcus urinae]MCY3045637.1 aldo/keto reductase [Aerococcus urinae]MCY3052905.1 aldo/keto reductase [Aerococcus urinae]
MILFGQVKSEQMIDGGRALEKVSLTPDVSLSRIALGFWRLADEKLSKSYFLKFIEEVIDLGITTMDHADSYGRYTEEAIFGDFLKGRKDLKQRMEFVSKVSLVYPGKHARVKYYDNSKDYIIKQVERSLKKLDIDQLDVLLLHRPDWLQDPEEVALAFDQLYNEGKVKSFGVSNYLPSQYRALESYLNQSLVTNQIQCSAIDYENFENGTIDLCMEKRIHPMIWSPLSGGELFTSQEENIKKVRSVMEEIAEEIGAESIAEVAYAWLLRHPSKMIPIVGSYRIDYVKPAVKALDYQLTNEQWYMIWTAYKGHKVP